MVLNLQAEYVLLSWNVELLFPQIFRPSSLVNPSRIVIYVQMVFYRRVGYHWPVDRMPTEQLHQIEDHSGKKRIAIALPNFRTICPWSCYVLLFIIRYLFMFCISTIKHYNNVLCTEEFSFVRLRTFKHGIFFKSVTVTQQLAWMLVPQ